MKLFFYNDKCFSCKVCALYSIQKSFNAMVCGYYFVCALVFIHVGVVSLLPSPDFQYCAYCTPAPSISQAPLLFSHFFASPEFLPLQFKHSALWILLVLSMPRMIRAAITSAEIDSKPSRGSAIESTKTKHGKRTQMQTTHVVQVKFNDVY